MEVLTTAPSPRPSHRLPADQVQDVLKIDGRTSRGGRRWRYLYLHEMRTREHHVENINAPDEALRVEVQLTAPTTPPKVKPKLVDVRAEVGEARVVSTQINERRSRDGHAVILRVEPDVVHRRDG